MAESLETLLGVRVILASGAIMYGACYLVEESSKNHYKVGTAMGLAGSVFATCLFFAGTYLVNHGSPETK